MKTFFVPTMCLFAASLAICQGNKAQPGDDSHHSDMTHRGDHAMGFSHEKTTHHFRLFKDGGAIEVTANDPSDTESRDQIRMHLGHITKMFSAGNFNVPMFIHNTTPPGAAKMSELREQIQYQFQEMASGARVRILTANPEALEAIHAFLRFQITDHQTHDDLNVSEAAAK